MRQALWVATGVIALSVVATSPDLLLESRRGYETHAGREATYPGDSHGYPSAAPPAPANAPQHNPLAENRPGESGESQTKLTDLLLIVVGFLQFGAIVGQLIIYCRQAEIMKRQLASMRLAGRTARRVSETLPRVERAYISGGGPAYCGILDFMGGGTAPHLHVRSGKPNLFQICVNNYGETPGELIEIHIGFIDGDPPVDIPDICDDGVHFFQDWIQPDTRGHGIKWVIVPQTYENPIVFGRFYYRDVFTDTLHSSGFILRITDNGTVPVRAPRAYTGERDEEGGNPPRPLPSLEPKGEPAMPKVVGQQVPF